MRIITLLTVLLLSGCASSVPRASQQIVMMPFSISGGQTLLLPVTNGGPVPAENDDIKIQVAGFLIRAAPREHGTPQLTWMFGFTAKHGQRIEQVTIEEVAASGNAKLVLVDHAPELQQKNWSGSSESIKADEASAPWLYSSSTSTFVFKFSIKAHGMPMQILYQPSRFTAPAKQAMMSGFPGVVKAAP